MFPTEAVSRELLQLGLSTEPFQNPVKLVAICQHVEPEENPLVVPGKTNGERPGNGQVMVAAHALGLEM